MRPEYWAFLTAICWAIGSTLEKLGVKAANFTPAMGLTIRTFFSLLFLLIFTIPYWGELKNAEFKNILYIIIGGGLLSGFLGLTFLYTGLKHGSLTSVLTVAFCITPVLGAIIGAIFLKEKMSWVQYLGICLCVIGASITVFYRQTTSH